MKRGWRKRSIVKQTVAVQNYTTFSKKIRKERTHSREEAQLIRQMLTMHYIVGKSP